MLLYEKRFVEMNKVALIARGSDTSTHLKLLPLDQRNMPSSHTINKNLSTHIFNGTGVYLCRRKKLISAHFWEFDILPRFVQHTQMIKA